MKLYLIRHGESANNVIFSSTGDKSGRVPDPELTERGHQQAELLASLLADPQGEPHHHPHESRAPGNGNGSHAMGFGLTHVYCSLMSRSILTAQYIAKACGLPLMAHADIFEKNGIYEINPDGTNTGLPGRDQTYFTERFPELELPENLNQDGWYNRPFETETQFLERSKQVALDFITAHTDSDDSVAMVIHGDLIDQLVNELTGTVRHAENYENHWVANWAFHNTSITRIDVAAGSRVIVYTNRLQHLSPEMITW